MKNAGYYNQQYYRWDDGAKMSYMSIDNTGSANDEFWSYNDERSCIEKVKFVQQHNMGGVIIWELGSGYISSNPAGNKIPQLSAIYEAKTNPLAVEHNNNYKPDQFMLFQNYPNPFNPTTSIQYAISSTQFVTLKVFDLLGREVVTLVNEEKAAGSYDVEFRMQNLELSSGIYFYKLQAGSFVDTKKMTLVK
jgi:hypothetical protein